MFPRKEVGFSHWGCLFWICVWWIRALLFIIIIKKKLVRLRLIILLELQGKNMGLILKACWRKCWNLILWKDLILYNYKQKYPKYLVKNQSMW